MFENPKGAVAKS